MVGYLNHLGLGHVGAAFRDNGVDGIFLQELSVTDLIEQLGLSKLQARKTKSRLP